jgi:ABC-type transport system involved in cytochrome c biogenesis permease subunit
MFDLENEIQSWRQAAAPGLQHRQEILDELEDHLRDEFAARVRAGGEPQMVWTAALVALGDPRRLADEFTMAASVVWMPVRWVGFAFVVFELLLIVLLSKRWETLLGWHVLLVTSGYVAAFAIGTLGACSSLARTFSNWDPRRDRSLQAGLYRLAMVSVVATTVGVVLGSIWSKSHWGRYWNWDAREVGGLAVLGWGVTCLLSSLRPRSGRIASIIPVAANIVVALSWFGPLFWDSRGMHTYGYPALAPDLLIGWIVVNALIGGVALLPRRQSAAA